MSQRRPTSTVLLALVAPALAASTPAPSPSVPPVSTAAPSALMPSVPTPAPSASAPAPFPIVRGAELPSAESPAPAANEWKQGKRVAPTRGRAEHCELTLVREWLRVRCPGLVGAGVIAGEARGVSINVVGHSLTAGDRDAVVTLVVLPLRRGFTRLFALNDMALEYDSTALTEGGVLSVQWRDGRPDPVIILSGIPPTPGLSGAGFGLE